MPEASGWHVSRRYLRERYERGNSGHGLDMGVPRRLDSPRRHGLGDHNWYTTEEGREGVKEPYLWQLHCPTP